MAYLSDYSYRANDYIQLVVSAVDTTSQIVLVDFGLKTPSASSFTWEGAPACADSATSTATWCPAFDPSTLEGEGAYQVEFRAVDSVGNETTSGPYTLYVDDTAPTASSTYSSTWSNASTTSSSDSLDWTLTLTGTVSDATLTNLGPNRLPVSGSGVYTNNVMVSLLDARGVEAGNAAQVATNTLWSTSWTPTVSKTYTLTAVMNPVSGGPFTDVITVTYHLPSTCFAEINGDNVTDYSSVDAAALRNAVSAATTGTVKLAGTCAGVTAQSGFTQTTYLTQPLTLQGGYAPTDWTTPHPLTQPTTLDAQGVGVYSTPRRV